MKKRIVELISKNGNVTRYHTQRLIGSETIAEHSWGVAMLCIAMSDTPSVELLQAALYHDLAEHQTGDSPATAKWKSAILKEELDSLEYVFNRDHNIHIDLPEDELRTLKIADMLQLMIFVQGQWKMGNRTIDHIFENGWDYLWKFDLPLLAEEILKTMRFERTVRR